MFPFRLGYGTNGESLTWAGPRRTGCGDSGVAVVGDVEVGGGGRFAVLMPTRVAAVVNSSSAKLKRAKARRSARLAFGSAGRDLEFVTA